MMEVFNFTEWRDIQGYEGLYQVSDDGQVRSVAHTLSDGRKWQSAVLSPKIGSKGHRSVGLVKEGKRTHHGVHCLVLAAFVGPRPNKGMQGAHNDGDPSHNHVSNLRWDTPRGNLADRARHGTLLVGAKNPLAKLSSSDVAAIRVMKARGILQKDIGVHFGITAANVSSILTGKTWRQQEETI